MSTVENTLLFALGIFATVFAEQLKQGVDITVAARVAGLAALTTVSLWVGGIVKAAQQTIARAQSTGGEYPGRKSEMRN